MDKNTYRNRTLGFSSIAHGDEEIVNQSRTLRFYHTDHNNREEER